MPESPPLDRQPDPAAFGAPTNYAPPVGHPAALPADPDRERKVSDGATHVVLADTLGGAYAWVRGDMIHAGDLPDGGHSLDTLMLMKPYPAVRPMDDDDRRVADDHRRARDERLRAVKAAARGKKAEEPGPGAPQTVPLSEEDRADAEAKARADEPKKGK